VKAVFYEGGGRFTLGDAEPRPPEEGEVRLAVAYCGICGTDLHIAHGAMDHRVKPPQVIGHEMSGTVAEVGGGVDAFAVGDAVVVRPLDARGETPSAPGVVSSQEAPEHHARFLAAPSALREERHYRGDDPVSRARARDPLHA